MCARRLRSAAGLISSGCHILVSRCADRCANDTFLTSFRATLIDRFFSVELHGKGPRSKFVQEHDQTAGMQTAKNMARASFCHVSGATSQSCKVTRAIQNVHDQPESVHTRDAAVNVLCQVEFETISEPRICDAWH